MITCNCAGIAPTMPTCRTEHLESCPVWYVEHQSEWQAELKQVARWILDDDREALLAYTLEGR